MFINVTYYFVLLNVYSNGLLKNLLEKKGIYPKL